MKKLRATKIEKQNKILIFFQKHYIDILMGMNVVFE